MFLKMVITRATEPELEQKSVFGYQMRFDLNDGFPLVTTKKLHLKSIIHELLWFINGETNIKYLKDNGVKIWDAWADESGNLGPVYGSQWRNWNNEKIDQISQLIDLIKNNPESRRMLVSAWNPSVLPDTKKVSGKCDEWESSITAMPCLFQFYVSNNKLSCQLYQRSADIFLGVPFNIASYALFTHMIAHVCNLDVGDLFTHLEMHISTAITLSKLNYNSREPRKLPTLNIKRKVDSIFDFKFEDFEIINYDPHPHIKGKVSV